MTMWNKLKSFVNPDVSDDIKIESLKNDRLLTVCIMWVLTLACIYLTVLATSPVEFSGEIVLSGDIVGIVDLTNFINNSNVISSKMNSTPTSNYTVASNGTIMLNGDFKVPYRLVTKKIISLNEDY